MVQLIFPIAEIDTPHHVRPQASEKKPCEKRMHWIALTNEYDCSLTKRIIRLGRTASKKN
jgi:hypothetical protein